MGLHVYSLENMPESENRDYLVYLLEYGWHEPLAKALNDNFGKMAEIAAQNKAVVVAGVGDHFEDDVFSWHGINNEAGEEILPAILITNAHPSYFRNQSWDSKQANRLYREDDENGLKLILIPLKKCCSDTSEVVTLINKVFSDIQSGRDLSEFSISKELNKGIGRAIVDSIILEPNISGIGFSFNTLKSYFSKP